MKFMESFLKLSPVILLGGLVMSGIDILISASLSFFVAAVICTFTEKIKLTDVIECGVEGAKPATLLAFILMLAYAIGSIFMSSGVAAASIQLFIGLGVTGRSVALIAFLTTCMLSISTGTSWGTFAACIPIFMWLCAVVSGNPGMTFAACIGGSAFGDNIGLISDTTILSSGMQGVSVVDRIKSSVFDVERCYQYFGRRTSFCLDPAEASSNRCAAISDRSPYHCYCHGFDAI